MVWLRDLTENDIRNAIWSMSNGVNPGKGISASIEELRQELRFRGLDDRGYHNT